MRPSRSLSSRSGFTLVEVMVAVVILGITALSLAPLMLRSARSATGVSGGAYQTALMSTEVGRLNALPFSVLTAGTTCVTVSAQPFPHTRCTTVADVSSTRRRVTLIITPSANPLVKPDTVIFDRTYAPPNPLMAAP